MLPIISIYIFLCMTCMKFFKSSNLIFSSSLSTRVSDQSHFNRRIRFFWIWIHLKMPSNSKCPSGKFIINASNNRFPKIFERNISKLGKETNFHNLTDPKACCRLLSMASDQFYYSWIYGRYKFQTGSLIARVDFLSSWII